MASQEKQSQAPQHPAVAEAAGGLVLDPADVTRMLALKQHGWGAKRIARELDIARGTVRRYLRLGGYRPYVRRKTPRGVLEHLAWLKERFLAVRGNARVLLREAQERGIQVAYSTLARVIKPWREELAARARATVRFETPPGQQMQADFGELRVPIAGVMTLVHFCVLTLGYSRRTFVRAFLAERQEHWLAAMEAAFQHFGGVPREMLVDNAKALVTFHPHSGAVQFSEAFLAFCRLHGMAPRACRPFRARSKGKVESGVKYVKRNALAGMSFTSFEALEAHLERWMREVADVRVHGTTHERPIDRFPTEAAALLPVKTVAPLILPLARKVASDCLVDLHTNRYSVPHLYVGRRVEVIVSDGQVGIRCDGVEIARHLQARGRHQIVELREHYQGLWPRREPASPSLGAFDAPLARYEELAP
jgi:transposase